MIKTLHKEDCNMAFGRKDQTCPRCQELLNGALPRAGWNDEKLRNEAMRSRRIGEHYSNDHENTCDYALRGAPCVKFDW